jgi:hypothetical protein
MWTKAEEFDHIYFTIPANVNEDEFTTLFSSGGVMSRQVELNCKCVLTVHPKIGLKACRKCPVILDMYSKMLIWPYL